MRTEDLLVFSDYLLERFDADMKNVQSKMQLLDQAYMNLRRTWVSLDQVHQLFKRESEESQ